LLREKWNDNWTVEVASSSPLMASLMKEQVEKKVVQLPHDAMIHEERTEETKNAHQTGYYPGNIYSYQKTFQAPMEWEEKTVTFEFEGVYPQGQVYINGDYAGGHLYGYSNFYVCADDFLKYGEVNTIKVIVNNSQELNSRWYSGSGIYRNVNILVGDSLHIKKDGVRIHTPEVEKDGATVVIDVSIKNLNKDRRRVHVITYIYDDNKERVGKNSTLVTVFGNEDTSIRQRIFVDNPKLWDCDQPNLYTYQVELVEEEKVVDEERGHFGIRKLSLDPKNGLRINGKTVKLRGACIHHDNGIIGACTLERAEERRCEQLKEAGFNCIRSAHHPMSRAMLDACDKVGMLVLDELSDMWTRPKNHNDYSQVFPYIWEQDVEALVAKDFNHPSVIMYITGNEIQEAGTAKGAGINRAITNKIRSLDDTRYVTSAFNGLLASADRMMEIFASITGQSMEELAQSQTQEANVDNKEGSGGSDALNSMMSILVGPMADKMAASDIMTEILEEFVDANDVAGYNYLTGRHELEKEINPNRIVLGTETFPADIYRLWKIVKENSNVIGDLTWTGYDYLGEAGIGIFYYDGRIPFQPNWPSSVAYIGDIDITGYRRPISYYREIIFGLRKDPYIGVERLDHYGKEIMKTAWMWKDEIASWTWDGFEGKPAIVNVYANGDTVELFLNDVSLGKKPCGEENEYLAIYEIEYAPGELKAVSYTNGEVTGTYSLHSASKEVELNVEVDREVIQADGADLSYIRVGLVDEKGNHNLQLVKNISVNVEGEGYLQGFGSADPLTENHYYNTSWDTYDGYVLAVIRSTNNAGEIRVTFTAEGCEKKEVIIKTK